MDWTSVYAAESGFDANVNGEAGQGHGQGGHDAQRSHDKVRDVAQHDYAEDGNSRLTPVSIRGQGAYYEIAHAQVHADRAESKECNGQEGHAHIDALDRLGGRHFDAGEEIDERSHHESVVHIPASKAAGNYIGHNEQCDNSSLLLAFWNL